MTDKPEKSYGESMDDHFRYGGETEGRGPIATKGPSGRMEEARRFGRSVGLATDALIGATLAVGTAKDPGYIGDLVDNIPFDKIPNAPGPGDPAEIFASIFDSIGNFAYQHPNPTIAFFGVTAIAAASGRGWIPVPRIRRLLGKS